ncbi:thioredoxin family protein [Pedosphaera parvula]|uniref:Thioredoxin domain protein n=1 Tax=Pedosphaera parvula (strain Ellin514) TaxID=320771 RepID=B9X9M6_PEDPL|nr:thioredoxin family protein [Pedosphaera parvula]EEF63270.1 Thioredoxin domain protein [Pedosphaera parvula Ellin514]
MKIPNQLIFVPLLILLFAGRVTGEVTNWSTDFTNTLKTAQARHHPVLMEFTAPWCPYCKMMETKVFKDRKVTDALNQFERVAVNIDNNAELAAMHSVHGIPAFVILDSDGEEVVKSSGFMEAEPFTQFLQQGVTNLSFSVAQKEEFDSKARQVEAMLNSTNPKTVQEGIAMVLDFCDRKEKVYRTFGVDKLSLLAQRQPELLLEGLRNPGLMARIRVANLLRQKLGNDFNIDPWEKEEAREKAILEWKSRLVSNLPPR